VISRRCCFKRWQAAAPCEPRDAPATDTSCSNNAVPGAGCVRPHPPDAGGHHDHCDPRDRLRVGAIADEATEALTGGEHSDEPPAIAFASEPSPRLRALRRRCVGSRATRSAESTLRADHPFCRRARPGRAAALPRRPLPAQRPPPPGEDRHAGRSSRPWLPLSDSSRGAERVADSGGYRFLRKRGMQPPYAGCPSGHESRSATCPVPCAQLGVRRHAPN
jgi:hypothetical protein